MIAIVVGAEGNKHSLSHRVSESQKSENDLVGWFSSEPLMGLQSTWQPGLQASQSLTGSGFVPKVAPRLGGSSLPASPHFGLLSRLPARIHWQLASPGTSVRETAVGGEGREGEHASSRRREPLSFCHLVSDVTPTPPTTFHGSESPGLTRGEGPAGRERGEGIRAVSEASCRSGGETTKQGPGGVFWLQAPPSGRPGSVCGVWVSCLPCEEEQAPGFL